VKRRRDSRGFTLVEVLIALVVFAIGALTMVAVVPMGVRKNNAAAQQTRASVLASRCAERLLTLPYDDPDLDDGSHTDPGNPYFARYHVRWDVAEDQPIDRCKRITITVRYPTSASPSLAQLVVVSPEAD
jgi:prepilin-type N-terminal cleavage/methylation domain-containing protein